MNFTRLAKSIDEINQFGYSDKGITRLAYSKLERQAVEYFGRLCIEQGMEVKIDTCGNLIARREGRYSSLPAVACGSHLDTVINGGNYDGTLGVMAALEVIRSLNDQKIITDHPLEIICFACEESSRFGVSTLGSKAMSGQLDVKDLINLKDRDGISIQKAFLNCSLNISEINKSSRSKKDFKAFFELHIEQGPILEKEKKQIGIANGIAAPTRFEVRIQGKAAHSGTTPIKYRQDAFLGAAEIALEVERLAKIEAENGTVATVGVCEVKPGAMNVVPDAVNISIDIRGTSMESKNRMVYGLRKYISQFQQKRRLYIDMKDLVNELPVVLDSYVIDSLIKSCEKHNISYMKLPSGAGHDSMNMAALCPTGLIFLPSKEGVSHHKDEFTSPDDISIGTSLLKEVIIEWSHLSKHADNKDNTINKEIV
ncbi:Zn-dependent hydrolase [Metabacillus idriensis]|uniref:Zn-dependent hydrolase n=1 Tax=Metabacillus idriensis TaxID=324768 RepID=UPI001749DD01|nr:Zn-dependent hydrolase [Metabacillus idriensis]